MRDSQFISKLKYVFSAFSFLVIFAFSSEAIELEFKDPDIEGSFDTTVTVGASIRAQGRDPKLIGQGNGGEAYSLNGDDGNLNYDSGDITSLVNKFTNELELKHGPIGFFGRTNFLYDFAIMNIETDRTVLSNEAEEQLGFDMELLDAYMFGDFDLGGPLLTVRAGQQVISWGESTFIPNGINTINPVDVSKLRTAGAELRDAFIPLPSLYASLVLTDRLSLDAFYMLEWDHTRLEPKGSYFSTSDIVSPGGDRVILGFGQKNPSTGTPADDPITTGIVPGVATAGASVPRGPDREPKNSGQFGLALRYFEPYLGDTEFGFYYTRLHSRLPVISSTTGSAVEALKLSASDPTADFANSARYYREFPEGIHTLGASFNTQIDFLGGLALQGEGIYRINQPLQIDDVELLFATLGPINSGAASLNQVGSVTGFEQDIQGWARKNLIQTQFTMTKVFGPVLFFDQFVMLGEFGLTHILDMESKTERRYEGPGTYRSGTAALMGALGGEPDGFGDPTSYGYRLVGRTTLNNAIGSVNLLPGIAFSHDVSGTTPAPITNFVEDRMAVTASMGASYLASYTANLSYTNFFGGGRYNLLNDRDYVSVSASLAF